MSEITFRPLNRADNSELNFVRKAWIRYSMGHSAPLVKKHYAEAAKRTVAELLERSSVTVAEYTECPGQLFGFVAFEPERCLHVVYVKELMRNNGIGKSLLGMALEHLPTPVPCTIRTKQSRWFVPGFSFSPKLVNNDKKTQ